MAELPDLALGRRVALRPGREGGKSAGSKCGFGCDDRPAVAWARAAWPCKVRNVSEAQNGSQYFGVSKSGSGSHENARNEWEREDYSPVPAPFLSRSVPRIRPESRSGHYVVM